MTPAVKLTIARVRSGSSRSGAGNRARTGSRPTHSRLSLARAASTNRSPNVLMTVASLFTGSSAHRAPTVIATRSRSGLFRPPECTYTRRFCDRAAIEPGASMDVWEYRVKAREGGWQQTAAGDAGVTPIATRKSSKSVASMLPLPEVDPLSGVRLPTMSDVARAREVIARYLQPTPLLATPALDALLGFEAFLKC